ncbi:hypothetical protein K466DRAFT_668533 [Polyporus arcularius HHB13444]|uniref:Secreted protein n=1 Tax=Polyporus arcularius HHB13444 TaxID=1314778 RepID=A0A5C3NX22_9APHY|nr:hypothetical protein K466DRAFT_668533 [Polyporus arcularius HHB13444]
MSRFWILACLSWSDLLLSLAAFLLSASPAYIKRARCCWSQCAEKPHSPEPRSHRRIYASCTHASLRISLLRGGPQWCPDVDRVSPSPPRLPFQQPASLASYSTAARLAAVLISRATTAAATGLVQQRDCSLLSSPMRRRPSRTPSRAWHLHQGKSKQVLCDGLSSAWRRLRLRMHTTSPSLRGRLPGAFYIQEPSTGASHECLGHASDICASFRALYQSQRPQC